MTQAAHGASHHLSRSLVPMLVLALVWGCNWPILKLGVTELAPLTFRSLTLPFAALGMLAVAKLSGDSIRVPRALWPKLAALAFFNIAGWNGLVLFGVQQLPAGRSAILAYTMPVWATVVAYLVLREPINRRKAIGLAMGMAGMVALLGEDLAQLRRSPTGSLMILGAAITWSCGTVLLRKWKLALPQNTLSGWMMLLGCMPLAIAAPFFDHHPLGDTLATLSRLGWFAILYNILMAGTIAHWAWFTLARTLPVAVSGMASLPVPVVGVISGMLILGERPGPAEWAALALVLGALGAVLWPERPSRATRTVDTPEP